jgi:hypothetical protein
MSQKKIAVITDSLSAGFYFHKWHWYYGTQFGNNGLYVVTYSGLKHQFKDFDLGGVFEVPHLYNDQKRSVMIAGFVRTLLCIYDYVIRVDADEFLIPDPRKYGSLAEYAERMTRPYVTSIGYDVIQSTDEPDLDFDRNILVGQRRSAFSLTALNKTCITSIPLEWTPGFHFCSVYPWQDELFLLHMKRADIASQIKWNQYMAGNMADDDSIRKHYDVESDRVREFHDGVFKWPKMEGWDEFVSDEFNKQFFSHIKYIPGDGMYWGEFTLSHKIVTIPDEFNGII